jgi:Arc/MetJ-type ribon-helix-helix transcriptional regulator
MTRKEAAGLLRRQMRPQKKGTRKEISDLIDKLECSPLTITRAAAAISIGGLSVQEYTDMFEGDELKGETASTRTARILFQLMTKREKELVNRERRRQAEQDGKPREAKAPEKQNEPSSFAMGLLSLMCLLDPHELPRRLLSGEDPADFTMAMSLLRAFRLVDMQRSGEFSLASQVRDAVRAWLEQEDMEAEFRRQARALLADALNRDYTSYEDFEYYQQLKPHVATLVANPGPVEEGSEDASHLRTIQEYESLDERASSAGVRRRIQQLQDLSGQRNHIIDELHRIAAGLQGPQGPPGPPGPRGLRGLPGSARKPPRPKIPRPKTHPPLPSPALFFRHQ